MPRKCAFGCETTDIPFHVFPNPYKFPEKFQAWVNSVGGRLETPSDYEYFRKKRVCDLHFKDSDRNCCNRLNALAVPSSIIRNDIPESVVSQEDSTPEPVASTSYDMPESANSRKDIASQLEKNIPDDIPVSANSKKGIASRLKPLPTTSWKSHVADVAQEHNYCIQPEKLKRTLALSYQQKAVFKNLKNRVNKLKKKGATLKSRLDILEKMETSLQKVTQNMSKPAEMFIKMQFKGSSKKSKGRRFSLEEKVMSMSIYKRSPKCYSLLNKYFVLPSARTLKKLLVEVKVEPGINEIIFEKIKKTTNEMDQNDRLCTLIFDEMSITPSINFDSKNDRLKGFSNYGKNLIANHVLVFMVKGIVKNFKQPVAYYFTSNMVQHELKTVIKDVATHVMESGLIILCTVCDQSAINVSAINDLVRETRENYVRRHKEWKHDIFRINTANIIPLFDVPHLIKGVRNNLLTKDMKYTYENKEYFYKWDYVKMLYTADKMHGELRILNKLTEEHVIPDKIKKMRVKTATQVFSHSVAVAAEHLSARGDVPETCKQIIPITLMLDNLFDSLNCNTFTVCHGKIYKAAVKRNSSHHRLWVKAKIVLKTVKFIEKKKFGTEIRLVERTVPSVINFIKTIEGMEALWKILSQKYLIDAFFTRNCNQDPIENFFGNIRSYGVRNVAPNSVTWEGAFKALLLNNYNSPHSIHSNCEDDNNACLQSLDFFVKNPTIVREQEVSHSNITEEPAIHFNVDILQINYENDAGQRNYVCGWVLTKCLKNIVKQCKDCRKTLIEDKELENNAFIRAKEYCKDKKWLCYPSQELVTCFHEIQNCTSAILKCNVPKYQLKNKIKLFVDTLVDLPFKCEVHKKQLKEYFVDITINILVYSWCRSINRILCGKIKYDGEDELKLAAQLYFDKHKHFNK